MKYIFLNIFFLCYFNSLFSQEKINVVVWNYPKKENILNFQINDTVFDINILKTDSFNLKNSSSYIVYCGYSKNIERTFSLADYQFFLDGFLQTKIFEVNYFDTICSNHQKNDSLENGKWFSLRILNDKSIVITGIKTIKNNLWDGYFKKNYTHNQNQIEYEAKYQNGYLLWGKNYNEKKGWLYREAIFFDTCSLVKEVYTYYENGVVNMYNNTIIGLSLHFDEKGTPIQIDEINKFEQGDGSYYKLKKLGEVNDKKYLKYLHKNVGNKPE